MGKNVTFVTILLDSFTVTEERSPIPSAGRWSGWPIPDALNQDTALSSKRLSIVALACEGCGECVEQCENDALSMVDGKAVVDHERCILCGYCAPHCQRLAIRMV